jgi:hypothetical protein
VVKELLSSDTRKTETHSATEMGYYRRFRGNRGYFLTALQINDCDTILL